MKIAILFGEYVLPRPLDFSTLFSNSRGLTGSDLGVIRVSQEFAKMGHDISLFTCYTGEKPDIWEGVKLHRTSEISSIDASHDAVISWCLPDLLRNVSAEIVRLCSQQLNGFSYCQPGFDNFVDIWASPSQSHDGRT